jgi:hypothetical protein
MLPSWQRAGAAVVFLDESGSFTSCKRPANRAGNSTLFPGWGCRHTMDAAATTACLYGGADSTVGSAAPRLTPKGKTVFKSILIASFMILASLLLLAPASARSDADVMHLTGYYFGDAMSYKAHYTEWKNDMGHFERTFELAVNGPPDAKVSVRYDDGEFATVITNSAGYGHLTIKASGKGFTPGIPAMKRGGTLTVGTARAVMQ